MNQLPLLTFNYDRDTFFNDPPIQSNLQPLINYKCVMGCH